MRRENGLALHGGSAGLGLEPPTMIKIDVEGHEPAVLDGLKGVIRKYGPTIFFEHIFLSPEQIRKLIPPGYKISFLLEDGTWTEDFDKRFLGHEALLSPPWANPYFCQSRLGQEVLSRGPKRMYAGSSRADRCCIGCLIFYDNHKAICGPDAPRPRPKTGHGSNPARSG